jgi:hypothetical protein
MPKQLTPQERSALIDQLDASFQMMPTWVKAATKHALAAPTHHPETGEKFTTFRQVIEAAADSTLLILKSDFEDDGDLLPATPRQ